MELSELQQDILSNNFNPIYVFIGEEYEIMKIYISQIKKPVVPLFSVEEVVRLCNTSSLFGNSSKVYEVYDDEDFIKDEKAWQNISTILGNSTLILRLSDIDKRSKFYKHFSSNIVEFNKLPHNILIKYVKKVINLSDKYVEELIEMCDGSYSTILLEANKINNYTYDDNKDLAFEKLKADGILANKTYNNLPLYFVDYLLNKNSAMACFLSEELKNESEVYILAVAYNGFRQVLSVQGLGENKENAAERTGLTPWQVKNAMQNINRYTLEELQEILLYIRKLEMGLKTGKLDQRYIIDLLILITVGGERI